MADETTTGIKPGYKTSEFWLSTLTILIGIAYATGLIPGGSGIDKILGLATSALATLGYTVSRGIVKK